MPARMKANAMSGEIAGNCHIAPLSIAMSNCQPSNTRQLATMARIGVPVVKILLSMVLFLFINHRESIVIVMEFQ
ncbi:MAG: hypothetical protein U1C48_03410 [Methylotenera sp.]|nr:hypothetical protein [Methylotenera sp.]